MTTPPLPAFASAPQQEPAQPRLSEGARLVDVFIAPRKTFEDIRVNASWWVPWLLTTVLSVAFGAVAAQKIDMVQFTRQQIEQSKLAQRQMEQLSPEQQEQQIRLRATITKIAFYVSPVFTLIFGLIVAAVLMGVFNFGFAAEVTFPQSLAIVFYAFLPRAILAILLGLSLSVASDPNSINIAGNPMPTNPGFFMDPQGNKFIYSLISYLDIFALWPVALLGLGFAAVSKNRKLTAGTGITTMFVIYAILMLIGAGFKSAF
ncbi:MAG TPA: YIP1 family protein [Candidatus Angelobacter sp.]|nr:YIP1 family protein [Candidatus Angelobacter sp.]